MPNRRERTLLHAKADSTDQYKRTLLCERAASTMPNRRERTLLLRTRSLGATCYTTTSSVSVRLIATYLTHQCRGGSTLQFKSGLPDRQNPYIREIGVVLSVPTKNVIPQGTYQERRGGISVR